MQPAHGRHGVLEESNGWLFAHVISVRIRSQPGLADAPDTIIFLSRALAVFLKSARKASLMEVIGSS